MGDTRVTATFRSDMTLFTAAAVVGLKGQGPEKGAGPRPTDPGGRSKEVIGDGAPCRPMSCFSSCVARSPRSGYAMEPATTSTASRPPCDVDEATQLNLASKEGRVISIKLRSDFNVVVDKHRGSRPTSRLASQARCIPHSFNTPTPTPNTLGSGHPQSCRHHAILLLLVRRSGRSGPPKRTSSFQRRWPWVCLSLTPELPTSTNKSTETPSHGPVSWHKVASHLPGRNNKDCRKRWHYSIANTIRKGTWMREEDEKLRQAVELYGARWSKIAEMVGTRNGDQCWKRWYDCLDPRIDKSPWTAEEVGPRSRMFTPFHPSY